MKPINLTLSGLKSFNEKVSIDFKQLLKGGLFGIFGDTGSGKSTLLNAIVYALYANFDKEHINKRTDKTYIDFVFEISVNSVRHTYEVERTFSQDKPSVSFLYELTADGKYCIAEKTKDVNDKILSIIGLKADEFEQCIVLPQGKFDKFLSSGRADRISIIENLFGLEKYGKKLKISTDILGAEIRRKKDILNDRLHGLTDYTEEGLLAVKNEFNNTQSILKSENEKLLKYQEYIDKYTVFYNDCKRLEIVCEELNNLNLKRDYFIKAKSVIDDLGKIENIVAVSDEITKTTLKINQNKQDFDVANKKLADTETQYNNAKFKKETELLKLKEECDSLKIKLENLKSVTDLDGEYYKTLTKLTELANEYKNNERNLNSYKLEVDALKNKVLILNQKLLSINTDSSFEKLLSSFTSELDNYLIEDEINFLTALKNTSEFDKTVEIKSEVLHRIDNLQVKLKSFSNKNDIKSFDLIDKVKNDLNLKATVSDEITALNNKISDITAKISSIETTNSHIKNQGVELKENSALIKSKIFAVTGGEDLKVIKAKLQNDLAACKSKILKIETDFDTSKDNLYKTRSELLSVESVIKTLNENLLQLNVKLSNSFFGEYVSVEKAKECISLYGDNLELKNTVKNYFNRVAILENERDTVNARLSESNFDINEFVKIKENRDNLSKSLLTISENYGNLQNTYKNYEHNFKNKCIIEKDLKEIIKEQELLDKLLQVVDRRKLLEFIADEYLKEITKLARKTVFSLTGGKYGLEYKGEFCVTDNLNGGITRSVSTLSGGETFIVSLSLALALSQEIFSKSMRPIEFFFLDEGFGTLDKNLTEIVVSSLNKLKNANFSIGLISHVSELIDAVDSKIFVTPQTIEKGSQIICQI